MLLRMQRGAGLASARWRPALAQCTMAVWDPTTCSGRRPFFGTGPTQYEGIGEGDREPTQREQAPSSLMVREQPGAFQRWLDAGTLALRRLLTLVTLRGSRAPELYIRHQLETVAGLDPFTVDLIALKNKDVLRLSWQQDIEPVLEWLGAQGLRGADAAEVIAICPSILAKSVDDQLQPLAELVEQAGGCVRAALLRFPALVEVPVAHLRGTWHVLRQLGASDRELSYLLVSYPDLYAQLARTLRELFSVHGRLGWKAYNQERQRYAGVLFGGRGGGDGGEAGTAEGSSGGEASSSSSGDAGGGTIGRIGDGGSGGGEEGPRLAVASEETQFVCDSDVSQGLQRVQAALSALAMLPPAGEEHEAALSELQYEIDKLAHVEGVCLRQD